MCWHERLAVMSAAVSVVVKVSEKSVEPTCSQLPAAIEGRDYSAGMCVGTASARKLFEPQSAVSTPMEVSRGWSPDHIELDHTAEHSEARARKLRPQQGGVM